MSMHRLHISGWLQCTGNSVTCRAGLRSPAIPLLPLRPRYRGTPVQPEVISTARAQSSFHMDIASSVSTTGHTGPAGSARSARTLRRVSSKPRPIRGAGAARWAGDAASQAVIAYGPCRSCAATARTAMEMESPRAVTTGRRFIRNGTTPATRADTHPGSAR